MSTISLRYTWAQSLFVQKDYAQAATILADLLDEAAREEILHGTTDLELLLARAYYHSAQLGRAEQVLLGILEREPNEAYARLLMGRTLQRQRRHDEARGHIALAKALGQPVDNA
jgi:Flp pilus assembly protein TadD